MTGTLHEVLSAFMSYLWVNLPGIRNVSDKNCRENQKTHFIFILFFPPKIMPFTK